MPKVIHFGAGKIGRGFIGAVLNEAGHDVVFADVDKDIIDQINAAKEYTLHIIDRDSCSRRITGVSAIDSTSEELPVLIAEADLITTAVSLKVLPYIAPAIAAGIKTRSAIGNVSPLNIICCENGIRATSTLKQSVTEKLDAQTLEWMKGKIGFADCSVDRIVPIIRKFGFDPEYHAEYVEKIISRFSNPHLNDLVSRVAHDPIRKLGSNLYFAYPMKMAMDLGLPYDKIALAAAAALHYDNPEDPQSVEIRKRVAGSGPAETFSSISGIIDQKAATLVAQAYETLKTL